MTKLEEVAKAIFACSAPYDDRCCCTPDFTKCHMCAIKATEQARAAMGAMRDPSKRMLKAASAAMSPGKRPTQKRVSCRAKHGIRYRAMIDAELEGS